MSYEGISGSTSAMDISQIGRFKIAIVGRVKSGKSWLACTMPGKKFVFDFDNRKESIAGKPDVEVKTYQDVIQGNPQALAELEKDVKMFEYLKKSGKPIPEVFILDSMTWFVKAAENDLMKSMSNLSRSISISSRKLSIPSGWDVTTAIRNISEDCISRLADLGHVICTFHEEPEKDRIKSTPDKPEYTGAYAIHPYYLRTLLSTFNETWRIRVLREEYILTCQPMEEFGASTTMKLDKIEKGANIEMLIKKHLANSGKKESV